MRLFHGTTVENMLSILENGFNTDNINWTASESDKTYFFTEDFFNNEYDIESDDSCKEIMKNCAVSLVNPDMKGLVAVYIMKNDESLTRLMYLANMKKK